MRIRLVLARGFTLTEMAVVFAIVALLVAGAMATLSSQIEQRNYDETRQRLDSAVEALIAYAIVNRRLPCPATAGTTGDESPTGGGTCATNFSGFLPAKTIGIQQTDASGYAIDPWNNRIRYAVATGLTGCTGGTPTLPHFTSSNNLKANGVSCRPNNLLICARASGVTEGSTPSCGSTSNQVTGTEVVAFLVLSTGPNGSITADYGPDETENITNNVAGAVFVHRTPTSADSTYGKYDDILIWVPASVLYARMINAGVLP